MKYSIPSDVADDLEEFDNLEGDAEMEMVIKAKRDKFLGVPNWMQELFQGRAATSDIVEINGIEYDNVKVQIDLGKKKRTLNLGDIKKLRMNIDISDNVQIATDGHPTFDSIREKADDVMPELESALRWNHG